MKKSFLFVIFALLSINLFAQTAVKKDALVLYHNGDYRESIRVCEAELLENPNRIESYVVMCWSLVKNKQYAEAEQRAMEGLVISPYDLRLIEVLGEAKFYLGKNKTGILYIILCFFYISPFLGFIDAILMLISPTEKLEKKYNCIMN
jgi:TM2 domain-containing membrane protein YozV